MLGKWNINREILCLTWSKSQRHFKPSFCITMVIRPVHHTSLQNNAKMCLDAMIWNQESCLDLLSREERTRNPTIILGQLRLHQCFTMFPNANSLLLSFRLNTTHSNSTIKEAQKKLRSLQSLQKAILTTAAFYVIPTIVTIAREWFPYDHNDR